MLNNDIVCVFVWFIWVFLIIKILKWHFSMNFYYIVNCYFSQFGRIIMIQILWYNICFKSEKIMFWNVSRCPMIDRLNLKVNDLDLTLLQNQGHMWPLSGTGFFFSDCHAWLFIKYINHEKIPFFRVFVILRAIAYIERIYISWWKRVCSYRRSIRN